MAFDKAVDTSVLEAGLRSIGNTIRTKTGSSAPLEFPQGMVAAIDSISGAQSDVTVDVTTASNPKVKKVTGGKVSVWGYGTSGTGFRAEKHAFTGNTQILVSLNSDMNSAISPIVNPDGSVTGLPAMSSGSLLIVQEK